MTLEERIHDRIIFYQVKGDINIAIEIAELHIELAKRKNCKIKIAEACGRAIYWMRNARVEVPLYLEQLSCYGQLEELEKVLAKAKVDLT
jgi:hypothetical protein